MVGLILSFIGSVILILIGFTIIGLILEGVLFCCAAILYPFVLIYTTFTESILWEKIKKLFFLS